MQSSKHNSGAPIADHEARQAANSIDRATLGGTVRELLLAIEYLGPAARKTIIIALGWVAILHRGQRRDSGHPFVHHVVAVALICARWQMPADVIIAALLHDTAEDGWITIDNIRQRFGGSVSRLVEGVTNVDNLDYQPSLRPVLRPAAVDAKSTIDWLTIVKLFENSLIDAGVFVIKLADRLHNLSTLGDKVGIHKRLAKAEETLAVYVPLADRLGMSWVKRDLESLCFEHLEPEAFDETRRMLSETAPARKLLASQVVCAIEDSSRGLGVAARVTWRDRSALSAYRKMQHCEQDGRPFDTQSDPIIVEVIVASPRDCYTVLGGVHGRWRYVDGEFDDHLSLLPANGYRSVDTTVLYDGHPIRILIRTEAMHAFAEYGFPSLWQVGRDGENDARESPFAPVVKHLFDTANDIDPKAFVNAIIHEALLTDRFEVMEPDGTRYWLPIGATVLDFAYMKGVTTGHGAEWAKVDDEWVDIREEPVTLQPNQTVLLLGADGSGPEIRWAHRSAGFLARESHRAMVRNYFAELDPDEAVPLGKQLLSEALDSLPLGEIIGARGAARLAGHDSPDRLALNLGRGRIDPADLAEYLARRISEERSETNLNSMISVFTVPVLYGEDSILQSLRAPGRHNAQFRFPKCCGLPNIGEPVAGYSGRRRGIAVHRADCRNLESVAPHRIVVLKWDEEPLEFQVRFSVLGVNRPGLAYDILQAFKQDSINLCDIASDERRMPGKSIVEFTAIFEDEDQDRELREPIIRRVASIDGVDSVGSSQVAS